MYPTYDELEQEIKKRGQSWSPADREQAKADPAFGQSLLTAKSDWQTAAKAGDTAAAAAAHEKADNLRRRTGDYTGGADGSGYLRDQSIFRYDDPYADTLGSLADALTRYERFENPYQAETDAAVRAYLARGAFSYDLDTDPVWAAYQKMYRREGARANEDTLGSYAGMTGGMPSTAAAAAASQAQDYYNAKMTDKIPELYQLAWEMYRDEGKAGLDAISALRSLTGDARSTWSANLGLTKDQFEAIADRSQEAFDRAYKTHEQANSVDRENLDRAAAAEQVQYERAQDAEKKVESAQTKASSRAWKLLQAGMLPSDSDLAAAGMTRAEAQRYLENHMK